MTTQPPSPGFRPYLFVVREGGKMQSNLLNYRLQLLDTRCVEVLLSPRKPFSYPRAPQLPDFSGPPLDFQNANDEVLFLEGEN